MLPSNVNHIGEYLKIKNRIIRSIQIVYKHTLILCNELYQLCTEFGHLDIHKRSLIMKNDLTFVSSRIIAQSLADRRTVGLCFAPSLGGDGEYKTHNKYNSDILDQNCVYEASIYGNRYSLSRSSCGVQIAMNGR